MPHIDTKCPNCPFGYLFFHFDKSGDVWVRQCTTTGCDYLEKHPNRRKFDMPVKIERRNNGQEADTA